MRFLLLITNIRNAASNLAFLFILLNVTSSITHAQETWKAVNSPPPRLTGIVANAQGTVIVTGESGAFISANTGATWTALNSFPPGRLKVSSSGDFFVFGAEVWRFNNTLQRFEQLSRGLRQTGAFARAAGFVQDLETSTSGTTIFLALHNQGVVRLSATTLATLIVSVATITTATASTLTANPRTGELFGVWGNSLWSSRDNGSSWQSSTNASSYACSNRLAFGRTRLLQTGGAVANGACDAELDAMWERDDYTLFATPSGIFVERTPSQTSTQNTVSSGVVSVPTTLLDNTPFQTHPFGKGLRVVQFAESGNTILAATNRGVFVAEEIRIEKANPYLTLPQKIVRWREANNGLAANIEELTIVQNRFIAHSHGATWISTDSARTWNVLLADSLRNTLRVMAHIQTPDSALLFVSTGTVQHGIVRVLARESLAGVVPPTAATFTLPLGYVWLQDYRRNSVYPQNRSLQTMVRSSDGALLLFARDTTVSRLAPTHVVSSRDNGRTWQREAMNDMPAGAGNLRLENLGLGNITVSPRGYLFAEDRFFQRKQLFRSGDNGKTWQTLALGRVPEALVIHPTAGTLFVAGAPMLFSSNNGDTWQASTGLPFSAGSRFEGASELAFGTRSTVALNIRTLGQFFSQNSGVSLQQSMNTMPQSHTLKAAPNGDFYAFTLQSVMFSGDGGRSWQARTSGLSGVPNDIVLYDVRFDNASNAFLVTSRGIFRWETLQRNAARTSAFNASNHAANTAFSFLENTSGEQKNGISPNPASEQACITFTLPKASFCTLDLVNIRGESLRRLAEGVYDAGEHRVNVDVRQLSQGQYFCRLQHGQTTAVIPFSVLR